MTHPADGEDYDIGLYDDPALDVAALRRRREVFLTIVALVLVLAVAVVAAVKFVKPEHRTAEEILAQAHRAVRTQLGSGISVEFAPEGKKLKELGPGKYEVGGMLLAVGRQGLPFYFLFHCTVQELANRELEASDLTIIPMF